MAFAADLSRLPRIDVDPEIEASAAAGYFAESQRVSGGVFGHGYTYTGHPVSCAGMEV